MRSFDDDANHFEASITNYSGFISREFLRIKETFYALPEMEKAQGIRNPICMCLKVSFIYF